jgi:transcription initiation factor TFIIIB Brf1 subunit/transcription initiation factor TFIIB
MVSCPVCGAENEEDASYCARCGESLKEGVPRIIYRWRRGEKDEKKVKDELEEKTDTASLNWVTLFGLFIVRNVLRARERSQRPY